MTRRDVLASMALSAAVAAEAQTPAAPKKTGRIKQSVNAFVFGGRITPNKGQRIGTLWFTFADGRSLEDTCRIAAELGFQGYDMIGPADWPLLKKYNLVPTMYPFGTIDGINAKEHHDEVEKATRAALKECAAGGVPTIIAMAGQRTPGLSDQEGADNCVAFFNRVKSQAEDLGITICMELLNSKVNHKGYMFDHMPWGVEVCKRVNSPRVKILYDIYHAQIQDGDIVRTIRDDLQWIGHMHTAGNPGRFQIDDNQEINYRFIAKAIAETSYTGYVGHEYFPSQGSDPVACLKQAFDTFNV